MAIRQEELGYPASGRVLRFPAERAAARLRRQRVAEARRRLALGATGMVVIAALILGGGTGGSAVASRPGAPRTVVLQPGETLWAVATEFAPRGVDPRAYVDALEELNELKGAAPAGMRLTLPR
jgi:LysM domain